MKKIFFLFLVLISLICVWKHLSKKNYEHLQTIDFERDYTCDFLVSQENLDLSGEELEKKINEICYKEQQNTKFPKS